MTDKDLSGPAFPCKDIYSTFDTADGGSAAGEMSDAGMTRLDYFAAAALSGMCANPKFFHTDDGDLTVAAWRVARAMVENKWLYDEGP